MQAPATAMIAVTAGASQQGARGPRRVERAELARVATPKLRPADARATTRAHAKHDTLFNVTLQKPVGGKRGLSVMPVVIKGSSGIYVQGIDPGGAVDVHNRTCTSDEEIRPGDCLVRAGSASLDAACIFEALNESGEIEVSVLRQVDLARDTELARLVVCSKSVPLDLHNYLSQASTAAGASRFSSAAPRASHDLASGQALEQRALDLAVDSTQADWLQHAFETALETHDPWSRQETQETDVTVNTVTTAGMTVSTQDTTTLDVALGTAAAPGQKTKKGKVPPLSADAPRTTVMLRHLPFGMSRDALVDLLDQEGFNGMYDFIYLPFNLRTQTPFSYAFVNLVTAEAAEACGQKMDGYTGCAATHGEACSALWADATQGLEANLERYRNSPVMHESVPDACKPALFQDGVRIAFPPPTKTLKVPPARKSAADARPGDMTMERGDAERLEAIAWEEMAKQAALGTLSLQPPPGLEAEVPAKLPVLTLVRLSF